MARVGSRIGDYVLEAPLGEGGMGVVFRAKQLRLNRIVALKLLPFGRFSPEVHQKRFQAEAEAIAHGDLYLAYSDLAGEEAAGVKIGWAVVESLERHGLAVEWSGSFDKTIRVKLTWQRRVSKQMAERKPR